MPRPAILMLELDPAAESALNEALSGAGFEVYAADSPDTLAQALQATAFPLVVCDGDLPTARPSSIASRLHQIRPETVVVFTGREVSAARALDILRGGGAEFLQKPINGPVAVERIRHLLAREQTRRHALRGRTEVSSPTSASTERSSSSRVSGLDDQLIVAFARSALQTFLDIEKQSAEQDRQLRAAGQAEASRPLQAWICHHDADFVRGMLSLGPRAQLDFKPPLTSGGEVLDKLGSSAPDLIILGDALPDIPTPLVVETIKSQNPDIELLMIEGWGTPSRTAILTSGKYPDEERRVLAKADDLLALIEVARSRSADVAAGREFAERFRERHKEFLRRYAELMKRLESI